MPVFEVPAPDGKTVRMHTEQGFTVPDSMVMNAMPAKDFKLQLQWIKEMDVRDDDVIICAYPKTGTHWLWEVLSMLTKEQTEYESKSKEYSMLEFLSKDDVARLPSPRVLNTHHTPPILPEGYIDRKCKIIHVMRNPKDVCVSMYHHSMAMKKKFGIDEQFPFSQHLHRFISGKAMLCDYFWFIKQFEKFKKENPDYPLLDVYYEDMKLQPQKEIKRIATFLGKNISDELASEIEDKCKFDSMKKANEEIKEDFAKRFSNDGKPMMYRKGQIGDWKNHFTVAENELFDQWIEKQSSDSDIKFVYE